MAKVSQAQEPSMEEILASIRRIISDDGDDAPLPARTAPSISTAAIDALFGARVAPEDSDPIPSFLRQEPPAPKAAEPAPRKIEPRNGQPEPRSVQQEPRSSAPAEPRAEAGPRPQPAPRPSVTPEPVAAAPVEPVRRVVEPPKQSVAMPASPEALGGRQLLSPAADAAVTASFGDLATTLLSGQARTIEDLVKEMLRPMLKAWLDTNLPPLVERLVRDEIERVSRGR